MGISDNFDILSVNECFVPEPQHNFSKADVIYVLPQMTYRRNEDDVRARAEQERALSSRREGERER